MHWSTIKFTNTRYRHKNSMLIGKLVMKVKPHYKDTTKNTIELRLADSTGVMVVKVTDPVKMAEVEDLKLGQVKSRRNAHL